MQPTGMMKRLAVGAVVALGMVFGSLSTPTVGTAQWAELAQRVPGGARTQFESDHAGGAALAISHGAQAQMGQSGVLDTVRNRPENSVPPWSDDGPRTVRLAAAVVVLVAVAVAARRPSAEDPA